MKTIAVTIDEDTLGLLEELTKTSPRIRNRSAGIRLADRELAERESRRSQEAKEGEILRRNRARLNRQAKALVAAQARS